MAFGNIGEGVRQRQLVGSTERESGEEEDSEPSTGRRRRLGLQVAMEVRVGGRVIVPSRVGGAHGGSRLLAARHV